MFEEADKQNNKQTEKKDEKNEEEKLINTPKNLVPNKSLPLEKKKEKIAPPTPVISDFTNRMDKLREKGKKRGRRYSIIGIGSSLVIAIVVIAIGYYFLTEVINISNEVDNKDNVDSFKAIIDPDNRCNDSCCLASLDKINKNNYLELNEGGECPPDFNTQKLNCDTTLEWCEQIKEKEDDNKIDTEEIAEDENDIEFINSYKWISYRNRDHGYELEHPEGWTVILEGNQLSLNSSENVDSTSTVDIQYEAYKEDIIITYFDNFKQLLGGDNTLEIESLSDFIEKDVSRDNADEIEFASLPAWEVVTHGHNSYYTILIEHNNHFYEILFGNRIDNSELSQLEKQVLDTFQFIAPPQNIKIDTDMDGLFDDEEELYGSHINNPDSDGDGYLDGEEVKAGFNPMGEGKLN